jgi:hypothetical protein
LVIVEIFLPSSGRTTHEIIDKAVRSVRYAGAINVTAIPSLLERYGVQFGIIDNEPDISSTSQLCANTCLEMADQKTNQFKEFIADSVTDGGQSYKCWKIDNNRFLRRVLNNFSLVAEDGYPLYRFSPALDRWLNNNTELSPFRHFQSPKIDPETQTWKRTDKIDDVFFAAMFAEVAFSISLKKAGGFWGNL